MTTKTVPTVDMTTMAQDGIATAFGFGMTWMKMLNQLADHGVAMTETALEWNRQLRKDALAVMNTVETQIKSA